MNEDSIVDWMNGLVSLKQVFVRALLTESLMIAIEVVLVVRRTGLTGYVL